MPEKIVGNDFFSDRTVLFQSIDSFLTGYEERRHASADESGLSMAINAAKNALSASSHDAKDIDLIIGCIVPNENLYAEDINLIQHEIGAVNASVLPINTTCSTFLSALNIADSHISSGKKKVVLIVTAVDWVKNGFDGNEPNFAFAGDGAAAAIIDDVGQSLIDVYEFNNSSPGVFNSMKMKNPLLTGEKEYFQITEPDGVSTAKDLILAPIKVAKTVLERNSEVEVDKIIMHQSGLKMMNMWTDKISEPFDKVRHTLELFANMSAASIPVTLDYWVRRGEISRGDVILFFAPATGGHYISILWRY